MSEVSIVGFKGNGEAELCGWVNNATRGALAVWVLLGKKYIKESFSLFEVEEAWDLQYRKDVTDEDKIVLYSTFDKALVEKEHLERLIKAYETFSDETNLDKQAEILDVIEKSEGIEIVGWNQTSINENRRLENKFDEEKEEYISYNPYKEQDHFFIDTDLVLTYRLIDNKEKGRIEKAINMGDKLVVYDKENTDLTKEDIKEIKHNLEDFGGRVLFVTKEDGNLKIKSA